MKPKKLGLILLAVAIAGVVIWLFMRSPDHPATAPLSVSSTPTQAEPPMIAPVLTPPAPTLVTPQLITMQSVAALPAVPIANLQTDLKAVISDIARLWRAGQRAQMYQTYSAPSDLNPVILKALTQAEAASSGQPLTPQKQLMNEKYAQCYDALEDLTPTYNAAGDEATYPFTRIGFDGGVEHATQGSITFIKINGKWYIKPLSAN